MADRCTAAVPCCTFNFFSNEFASLAVTTPINFHKDIPFINDMGVEFVSAAKGQAKVALVLDERHLNSWQVAHGGVIMTLLDVVMAVAGRTLEPNAGGGVTVEMKTSFLQPGLAGSRLMATGTAFHRSTTMAFCEGEVRDQQDRLIAKALGTFKYLKRRVLAEGSFATPETK
jgi:acyl-CoA thioesterase